MVLELSTSMFDTLVSCCLIESFIPTYFLSFSLNFCRNSFSTNESCNKQCLNSSLIVSLCFGATVWLLSQIFHFIHKTSNDCICRCIVESEKFISVIVHKRYAFFQLFEDFLVQRFIGGICGLVHFPRLLITLDFCTSLSLKFIFRCGF